MTHHYDPFAHAEELGVKVIYRRLRTANGLWLPDYNTIVIKEGMRAVHNRVALAHELGHVVHGHEDDRPKHELQADRWAAEQLITPERLRAVAQWAHHPNVIAQELGVTNRLLRTYLDAHGLARIA